MTVISDEFYALSLDCLTELYGSLAPKDFNSLSATRGFVAHKQNLVLLSRVFSFDRQRVKLIAYTSSAH